MENFLYHLKKILLQDILFNPCGFYIPQKGSIMKFKSSYFILVLSKILMKFSTVRFRDNSSVQVKKTLKLFTVTYSGLNLSVEGEHKLMFYHISARKMPLYN